METTYHDHTAEYSSQPPNVVGCLVKTVALLVVGILFIAFTLGALVGPLLI